MAILLGTLWTVGRGSTGAQSNVEEYQIKAAFLYHFAQLVDWPADPAQSADRAMLFCTFGDDPFQGGLDTTVAGKFIGKRLIQVRHLQRSENIQDCQILFFGKTESKYLASEMAELKNGPVLTVGESEGFLEAGGMVCFLVVENKVRFAINLHAAEDAGLKIGSRLLVLAQSVIGKHREK